MEARWKRDARKVKTHVDLEIFWRFADLKKRKCSKAERETLRCSGKTESDWLLCFGNHRAGRSCNVVQCEDRVIAVEYSARV